MAKEEFGYAGGKGTWLVVFIVIAMATIAIGYAVTYFFPDLANWLKEGADPDKIIWLRELGR